MKYVIDHDYHIHSYLSTCSSDEGQTKEAILEIAGKHNLKTICITDHYWESTVKCNTKYNFWYEQQNFDHIAKILPLPQDENIKFLFGCEVDMDSDKRIGISEERLCDFDFIIVSTTHFHHMHGADWEDDSNAAIARRWIERFDAVFDTNLPFQKTGIAHLACGLINTKSREDLLETLNLIPDEELVRLFSKAKDAGLGIELNSDDMDYSEDEAETVLRMFRIAKKCGCKFYLGSDAHGRDAFDKGYKNLQKAVDDLGLEESDKFNICAL